jgi:multidrug efflux pump subunit AcrA (membrane-fusion protein)
VDVYVSLPQGSGLLLDSYVKGMFNRVAHDALVVPGAAVEADESGYCVFTVENGKAVRHGVEPGLAADGEIEISGTGLSEGTTVVTTGGRELSEGDAVEPSAEGKEQ